MIILYGWDIAHKNTQNSILKIFKSHQSDAHKLSDAPQKTLLGDRGAQGVRRGCAGG